MESRGEKRSNGPPRRAARQRRSRETVGVILEAAEEVLLSEGYAHATTNRIAERAGVSVGSIYQYFGGKDEIFAALVRRQTGRLVEQITAYEPDPARPLEEALRAILMLSLQASARSPETFRILDPIPDVALRRCIAESRRQLTSFVKGLLEDYRGRLRVSDLGLAAMIVVNASEGVALNVEAERFDERLVEELVGLFARYLLNEA